jgi:hypothetical protein
MARSSGPLAGIALAAAALAVASCGGSSAPVAVRPTPGPFAWLRPVPPPTGWTVDRLPSGTAGIARPPGWHRIRTDPGTVSAALLGPHGAIRGYLNATPQSGPETLANWPRFRPAHNRAEGDRSVRTEAAATGLRFPAGSGSCVMDRYSTVTARYREIACLVRGSHATTVIVAAAQPRDWARLAPALRRSVASFST